MAERQLSPLSGYRGDVWYSEYGVIIELDGRAYHRGQTALDDMDRDNDHQLVGVVTLRFGWRQVAVAPCRVGCQGGTSAHGQGLVRHPTSVFPLSCTVLNRVWSETVHAAQASGAGAGALAAALRAASRSDLR